MKKMLTDTDIMEVETIDTYANKEEVVRWMLEMVVFGEIAPKEHIVAFRQWLADDSHAEIKVEGLRRIVEFQTQNTFSRDDVDNPSDEARAEWRTIAAKLGMNPDLEIYRAQWEKNRKEQEEPKQPSVMPLRKDPNPKLWHRHAMRVAAVLVPVAIIAGGYLWFDNLKNTPAEDSTIAAYVATGSIAAGDDIIRHITLADGTEVALNRNSTLSYNDHREAELSGEAYFKVAKDPEHPFVIHSDGLEVTVLGTEFNFRADAHDSQVSLYEGKVKLDYENGTDVLEEGGKEFTIDYDTGAATIGDFDASVEQDWLAMENLFQYYPLGEIFEMIGTAYGVEFENMDAIDTTQQISFNLRDGTSLDDIMSMLRTASGDFDYHIEEGTVTLDPTK